MGNPCHLWEIPQTENIMRTGPVPAGERERLMKYFKLIRSGIDVAPLLEEVRSREEAWLIDTGRQDKIRVQRDTNTILLRAAVHRPDLPINENQESRLTSVSKKFPRARAFMTAFAEEMNCHLSRATIVRLKPQSQVFRHIDEGSYYFLRDRFHLVLQSSTGSVLMSGGEQVRMREGELWWFDNKQYHESYNESGDWRIHYIFDLLPADYSDLAVNPVFLPPDPVTSPEPPGSGPTGEQTGGNQTCALRPARHRFIGHSRTCDSARGKSAADFTEGQQQPLAHRLAAGIHGCEVAGRRRRAVLAGMRRPHALSGRRDGGRRDSLAFRHHDEIVVARNSRKRLHGTQGAQDLRHGQFDRGMPHRRANRHGRRSPEFGRQHGKGAGCAGTGTQDHRFCLRAYRL